MRDEPLVLGMETSCDEIGVGIVRGHTLPAGGLLAGVAALGSHLVAAGARPSKLDFAADSAMPLKLVGV